MNTTDNTPPSRAQRRVRHFFGAVLVMAFLVVGAAACQPAGCMANCIGAVTINPGATQVSRTTTVNTFATVELFKDAGLTQFAAKKSDSNISTSHTMDVGQMKPGTTYWWRVTAIDVNNHTKTNLGSFKTYYRQV